MQANNQCDKTLSRWMLLATVFITGASVLVIEIIGTRILSPFFGSGIYTWSALIATTLAALALGYIVGGRVADRRPQSFILFLLCGSAGIWTVTTPALAVNVLPEFVNFSDLRLGILASSLLLFFPNLFFLGAVGPFSIKLITRSESMVGTNSGLVFSMSTLGSLLAAIAAGFVLMPNYGVSLIFNACGFVLVAVSIVGLLYTKHLRTAIAIIIISVTSYYLNESYHSAKSGDLVLLDSQSSFYGQVQVIEKSGYKALLVDGVGQNYVSDDDSYNADYIQFISLLTQLQIVGDEIDTALVIGLGAGELPMLLEKNNIVVDVVEIDPIVRYMAEKHFSFRLPREQIYITDGRYYLNQSKKSYDLIVLDAFNSDQVAGHLLTLEALSSTKDRLTKEGLLAINVTSVHGSDDIASLYATLKSVFDDVRVYSDGETDGLSSFVFVTSDKDLNSLTAGNLLPDQLSTLRMFVNGEKKGLKKMSAVSDDYNPVSFQRRQVQLLWRSEMRNYLGSDQTSLLFN